MSSARLSWAKRGAHFDLFCLTTLIFTARSKRIDTLLLIYSVASFYLVTLFHDLGQRRAASNLWWPTNLRLKTCSLVHHHSETVCASQMEPLSIGASVIAVVGATGKVIKGIRSLKALRNAPQELDDLLGEVSQFEVVIKAIQNASENAGFELGGLLETALRTLADFESLIEYELTKAGTSDQVDRWKWIRSSEDVERLRGKLRDITANLVALVGVNTRYVWHPYFMACV